MPNPSLLQRLKERKLVQWALAYLAGAWVLFEVTDAVGGRLGWSDGLYLGLLVLLAVGFFVALVLAWYHGEKGRQRVSGPELLMVAALLVIAGGVLSMVGRESRPVGPGDQRAIGEVEDVAAALSRLPSIAVLPFANRSDLSENQYFSDGIQDELLTHLQRVQGLKVISRTSSDAYRDTNKTIPAIGRELNVDYLLEGSVQRAGDRVRIVVQLVDARNEGHLWAETYDRVLTAESLLDIQSEIVRTVAGELNIALRREELMRAAQRSTMDLEAYDLYMRGVALRGEGRVEESLSLLHESVERDPGFVGAHVALAYGHAIQYQYRGQRSEERAATARAAAERAVELAPESAEAQLAMGVYLYRVEKSYDAALDWLGRASGTLTGDYTYHYYRAITERRMGRWREAVASHEASLSLSPRNASAWREAGLTYLVLRRYDEAERVLQESRRLNPDLSLSYLALLTWFRDGTTDGWQPYLEQTPNSVWAWELARTEGRHEDAVAILDNLPDVSVGPHSWYPKVLLEAETLEALGEDESARDKYQEAANVLEPLVQETPDDERYHASLAWAYAGLGRRDEAVAEGQRAAGIVSRERDALGGSYSLFDLAAVHARLGETEEALEVLEDLLSAPARFAPNMLEDHFRLRSIQDDPRFKALMDRERGRVF